MTEGVPPIAGERYVAVESSLDAQHTGLRIDRRVLRDEEGVHRLRAVDDPCVVAPLEVRAELLIASKPAVRSTDALVGAWQE